MQTIKYVYWQEEGMWLGYLEEFPDYWTQGETNEQLEENLRDLYRDGDNSASIVTGLYLNSQMRHPASAPQIA
jgi:hypothetical protein